MKAQLQPLSKIKHLAVVAASEGKAMSNNHYEIGLLLEDFGYDDDSKSRNTERTTSSSPMSWNEPYSDEESQRKFTFHHRQRSYSDPLAEEIPFLYREQTPRRRSRSSCSRDEDIFLDVDPGSSSFEENRHRNTGPKRRRDAVPTLYDRLCSCFSAKLLSVLFVLLCYTTFWLPYPSVRPQTMPLVPKLGGGPVVLLNSRSSSLLPFQQQFNKPLVATQHAMLHARASPELELTYRPGLERFYEQEGFVAHAWTKYADLCALGIVILWAVVERGRRTPTVMEN